MNAQIVTIESLFQEQISYRIPQFQRPYAWEEKVQWGPLWEDVRSVADRFLKKTGDHTLWELSFCSCKRAIQER